MVHKILQDFTYKSFTYKKDNTEHAVKSKELPKEIIEFLKTKGRLKVSLF